MFRLIFPSRLLLVIALLALPTLACDLSSFTSLLSKPATPTPAPPPTVAAPVNIITNAVTSKNVIGDTFDPSGITDSFPADQNVFHVVVTISGASNNTAVKVIWLTSDNTSIGEYEIKADGSRNLDYTFKPDAGRLPAGNYRAAIYLNGKLDRTLSFSVQSAAASSSATSKSSSASPKPSGFIGDVVMAQGVTGDAKEPSNPTAVFTPSATFHAVVRVQNAPANTKFKATWFVTDVGSAADPNSLIDQTELTTEGTRNIDFTLAPKTVWPVGTYRVEIYVNGVLDTVKNFSVK